jgi:hypothetical protein
MTDRPRALVVLIAVFLLGAIFGIGGTRWWLRKSPGADREAMQNHPPRSPGGRQRVREQLQLTPEQESQYEQIMADSRSQMEALRAEQQPKIDAIFSEQRPQRDAIIAETNRKIMAILNEEQKKKFEAIWKEMSLRERRPPRGGRGQEPPPR